MNKVLLLFVLSLFEFSLEVPLDCNQSVIIESAEQMGNLERLNCNSFANLTITKIEKQFIYLPNLSEIYGPLKIANTFRLSSVFIQRLTVSRDLFFQDNTYTPFDINMASLERIDGSIVIQGNSIQLFKAPKLTTIKNSFILKDNQYFKLSSFCSVRTIIGRIDINMPNLCCTSISFWLSRINGSTSRKYSNCNDTCEAIDPCPSVNDVCTSRPCQNGGTCNIDNEKGYTCACASGFVGKFCEDYIYNNSCAAELCKNGGTCEFLNNNNSFTCNCTNGYYGQYCEEVNFCASSPCKNGGKCTNNKNYTTCECTPGYTGEHCEVGPGVIDSCISQPCKNNGTCINNGTSFQCICEMGLSQPLCEELGCSSNPCLNGGICVLGIGNVTCNCRENFTGSNCEIVGICGKNKVDSCSTPIPSDGSSGNMQSYMIAIIVIIVTVVLLGCVYVCHRCRKKNPNHGNDYRKAPAELNNINS